MPFKRCTKEEVYATRLLKVMLNNWGLEDIALITHSLAYVAFLRPYDTLYLLSNFEYWLKEVQCEQRFRVRRNAAFFVNWHCVNIFGISARNRKKLFVQVQ